MEQNDKRLEQYNIKLEIEHDEFINLNENMNTIYFNAEINRKTMSILINYLLVLEKKLIDKKKNLKRKFDDLLENEDFTITCDAKPITLYITTYGGDVYQVFSAIDTIKNLKIQVNTVCKGLVASAGTLLSLAGKKRYITKNSYMLIHEIRSGHSGKYTYLQESFENSTQIMNHVKTYYLENTNMTENELNIQLKKDNTWDAKTCLEKGLVDEII